MYSIPQNIAALLFLVLLVGCGDTPTKTAGGPTETDGTVNTAQQDAQNGDEKKEGQESTDKPAADKPAADKPIKKPTATMTSSKSMAGMSGGMKGMGNMKAPDPKDIKFKDKVESNATDAPKKVSELVFTNKDGTQISLADYAGEKNVVLVFTEGFNGMLCPFCTTQTSRLVANYGKFQERDCEVIVVYPGPEDHIEEFVEAARTHEKEQVDKVPFPIVLDKNFAAVRYFGIQSMHAHPSTYLIDKNGAVKFAYVGADMTADRPSVKAILARLDQLQ